MALFEAQPLQQSRLLLQTDLTDLAKVLMWFEQFNTPPVTLDLWNKCQLALTEGFTNAVRHAHQDLPTTTPIEIEVKLFADRLEMRIWDKGEPFDLLAKLKLAIENPPGVADSCGRGLLWMYQLTDKLCYTRLPDQRNCLKMQKKIK